MARMAPPLPLALRALLDLPPAERVLGPFTLVQQLGRGAFAPVWLAREVLDGVELRRAAIKLFVKDTGADPPRGTFSRKRVISEAMLLERLEHPNIVRFLFTIEEDARPLMGIVMEYVEGPTLDRRLLKGPLPLDEVLSIGSKIASALATVHRAGLVHRDVKPANIIVSPRIVKLIDFGIAAVDPVDTGPGGAREGRIELPDLPEQTLGEDLADITESLGGSGKSTRRELPSGTVGYMDPVCVANYMPATAASDIYGLGVTLFQCVTGKLPAVVAAQPMGGIKGEVLDGRAPPPRLAEVQPSAPPALASLIDSMLDPERDKRPTSAELIAMELERLRQERAGRPRRLPPEGTGPLRVGIYERGDRDIFFGRSTEAATALAELRYRGLLAIVGPARSGKTSFLQAAMVPRIEDEGLGDPLFEAWDVVCLEAKKGVRAALSSALEPFAPGLDGKPVDALVLALVGRAQASGRGIAVCVDGLEALVGDPDAEWVADLLARIADPPSAGVRAVVAVHSERLGGLFSIGLLGSVLPKGLFHLPPLRVDALRDALRSALAVYGYRFEDDTSAIKLCEALLNPAIEKQLRGALPGLWERRDKTARLLRGADLSVTAAAVEAAARQEAERRSETSAIATSAAMALGPARASLSTEKHAHAQQEPRKRGSAVPWFGVALVAAAAAFFYFTSLRGSNMSADEPTAGSPLQTALPATATPNPGGPARQPIDDQLRIPPISPPVVEVPEIASAPSGTLNLSPRKQIEAKPPAPAEITAELEGTPRVTSPIYRGPAPTTKSIPQDRLEAEGPSAEQELARLRARIMGAKTMDDLKRLQAEMGKSP